MMNYYFYVPALLLVNLDYSMYDSKDTSVLQINNSNFNNLVLNTEYPVLVEFYAPWCGHCQKLEKTYSNVADSLKKLNVRIGAINCDQDENKQLCSNYGIKGFPTLKMFPSLIKSKKKGTKAPIDYNGARDGKSIESFVKGYLPNIVTKLTESNPEKIMEFLKKTGPKVVLFNKKIDTPALFKSLAIQFNNKANFAIIDNKQKILHEKLGIEELPIVIYLPENVSTQDQIQKEMLKYEGELKYNRIAGFINQQLRKDKFNADKQIISIEELEEQETFEKECLYGPNTLCLVGVTDASEKNKQNLLKYLSFVKDEINELHVTWIDKNKQTKFIKQFEIENDKDYIGHIVIINNSKKRYYKMNVDSKTKVDTDIINFVQGVVTGSHTKTAIKYRFNPGLRKAKKQAKKDPVKQKKTEEKDEL